MSFIHIGLSADTTVVVSVRHCVHLSKLIFFSLIFHPTLNGIGRYSFYIDRQLALTRRERFFMYLEKRLCKHYVLFSSPRAFLACSRTILTFLSRRRFPWQWIHNRPFTDKWLCVGEFALIWNSMRMLRTMLSLFRCQFGNWNSCFRPER